MPASHPKTVGLLTRFFSRLRFPWLFGIVLSLFGVDLLLPDFVPFIDELLLATVTMLLGSWKQRKTTRSDESEVERE
jgi:hypothetical protein